MGKIFNKIREDSTVDKYFNFVPQKKSGGKPVVGESIIIDPWNPQPRIYYYTHTTGVKPLN